MIKFNKTLWVLAITLFTYLIYSLLNHLKGPVQNFYVKCVFENYRVVWDLLFAWSPIAMSFIWLCLLLGVSIYFGFLWRRKKWKWYVGIYGILMLLCVHYIWFYWFWGFNYTRIDPWVTQPVGDTLFYNELDEHIRATTDLRVSIKMEDFYFEKSIYENEIREQLREFLIENGIRAVGKPRCRYAYPSGSLLVWSTSGIYLPFSGESLIDPGLYPLAQLFTIPHELSHAFGVTHEAVCNFIAYKVCHNSKDPFVRYAAAFNYLKYLLYDLRRKDKSLYFEKYSELHPSIKADLQEERRMHDQYPEFLPSIRSWVYDQYLKSHGMAEGTFTYNQMVSLVIYDKQKNLNQIE